MKENISTEDVCLLKQEKVNQCKPTLLRLVEVFGIGMLSKYFAETALLK